MRLVPRRALVFYDPSIPYFGKKHAVYAFGAITAAFFLGILPFILLLLYPSRFFHRMINCCNIRSQALHVFMDTFQGSYKTDPCDSRYFAAWYLFLRLLFLLCAGYFTSILSLAAASMVMTVGALSVAIVRPYKRACHNTQDIVLLLSGALVYMSASADAVASQMDFNHLHAAQSVVLLSVILMVMAILASLFYNPLLKLASRFYRTCKLRFSRETLTSRGKNDTAYKTFAEVIRP